ncbi:hypothetical protein FIM08_03520 [SAR202 cluster bacterium AC-647-N09_OGT_505m]|nr:hypothetical protein [SAR202 cluster bacterium AC-647-N09_OGT_505m]
MLKSMLTSIVRLVKSKVHAESTRTTTEPLSSDLEPPIQFADLDIEAVAPQLPYQIPLDASEAPDSLANRMATESSLVQFAARQMDLSHIDIRKIGLTHWEVGRLRSSNILTVDNLANISANNIANLPGIGTARARQIQARLASFLRAELDSSSQPKRSTLRHKSGEEEDLEAALVKSTKAICEIFGRDDVLTTASLPPQYSKILADVFPGQFKSFDALEYAAQRLMTESKNINAVPASPSLKKAVSWLERALKHTCLDNEVNDILRILDDRERQVLIGRHGVGRPLTLEALGRQLKISRERVRQIQIKAQEKLEPQLKRATLMYSTAALAVLNAHQNERTMAAWQRRLLSLGYLKNPVSLDLLFTVVRATSIDWLHLPDATQPASQKAIPRRVLAARRQVLSDALKHCGSSGAVRTMSLTNEVLSNEEVEQVLRLNEFEELQPGWWTRDVGETVLERVALKVIVFCGSVSPSAMRDALGRHLTRSRMPSPPSEILGRLLERRDDFSIANGMIVLLKSPTSPPATTGPESIFIDLIASTGVVVSFKEVHHALTAAGFSGGSVNSLLRYSPIVAKVAPAMYSTRNANIDSDAIADASSRDTRLPANTTMNLRSDGVIELETTASAWLDYNGIIPVGLASSLTGEWSLIDKEVVMGKVIITDKFIRGLSPVAKNLDVTSGDRIRLFFNTWTREANMIKVETAHHNA